jgi:excisionase family DNA binding protein
MEVTVREAAALVGRSPRALRQWIASGRLPARRHGATWLVRIEHMPLTDAQRQRALARGEQLRDLVADVAPSPLATTRERRRRSLQDLDAFRAARDIAAELGRLATAIDAPHRLAHAARLVGLGALRLGQGAHEFSNDARSASFRQARRSLARAAALSWSCPSLPGEAIPDWQRCSDRIEQEVLPLVGGLLRWSSQRRPRP